MTERMDPTALRKQLAGEAPTIQEEKAPEDLPPFTKIEIDVTTQRGKRFTGEFIYHVPTMGDTIEIAKLKTAMLPAGAPGDRDGAVLAEMICYLEITLTKRPDWWKPHTFYSYEPIVAVYKEAMEYEARFRSGDRIPGGGKEGPASALERQDDARAHDRTEEPVDGSVQPSSQRSEVLVGNPSAGDGNDQHPHADPGVSS